MSIPETSLGRPAPAARGAPDPQSQSPDDSPPTPDSRALRCADCGLLLAWLIPSAVPAFVNVSIDIRHSLCVDADDETVIRCRRCDAPRQAPVQPVQPVAETGGAA